MSLATQTTANGFNRTGFGSRPEWAERGILDIAAAGPALFQEVVNRVIQVCHKRTIGAVTVLDFRRGSGDAHHLNRQSPGPDGKWVDDTTHLGCDDDLADPDCGPATYDKVSFPYKCMLVCGSVTRKVIARGRDFADIFAIELAHAVERGTYTIEKTIFQGNFDGTAPLEFDGLLKLINVYNGTLAYPAIQVLTPQNAAGDADPLLSVSGDLEVKDMDRLLDEIKRGPAVLFASKSGSRLINSLLQAQQNFTERITVAGGFRVATYDDTPIIKTDGINDDMAWGLDGSGNPQLTAMSGAVGDARTTAIVAVMTDEVWIDELTPMTVEPLPQCTTQRRKFEAYWDGTLVLGCPEAAAMIIGIKPDC